MKFIVVFLIISFQALSAIQAQVTIETKGESLHNIMRLVREQTGYWFTFKSELEKTAKPIAVSIRNKPLAEALQIIFKEQPFSYTIEENGKYINIVPKEIPAAVRRELSEIGGKITDTAGQGLPGATVRLKETGKVTITNEKGVFKLSEVPAKGTLLISMVGYETLQHPYQAGENFNVVMHTVRSILDEVQVIGYGLITKRLNTGSVASISAEQIEKQPVGNPLLALPGRMAGVEVNQVNGISGGAVKINIRGINTISQGMDPLFVVDGVPYNSNMYNTPGFGGLTLLPGGGGGQQNLGLNPLSLLNPSDIESIDVLKDADATAIYGSRAANGVVLITTKKGRSGPTKLDVDFQQGFGEITRRAKLMNTSQYLFMRREAFANDNVEPNASNAPDLFKWDQNSYTDWQDIMIGGTSNYTNAQVSLSGGSAGTQFILGGNFHRETTVFPGDWSDRKTAFHFNVNHVSPNQKLRLVFSGNFLAGNNQLPNVDFSQYITLAPNAPSLYHADGSLNWDDFSNNVFRYKQINYTAKTNNLIGNGQISYALLKGLEAKVSMGYNSILLDEMTTEPISSLNPNSGITTGGSQFNHNYLRSWIAEPQLSYRINLSDGIFSALLGGTLQRRFIDGQVIKGGGYTDDGLLETLAGANEITRGQTINEVYKYASVFARLNYNYKERYLINLTARRDGSSRFGPGRQYGNFGAVGAGWIFSNEPFFKDQKLISFGKLRLSYGTSGNEPATNYAFLELFNLNPDLPYSGGGGINPISLFTPDYRWEVVRKAELGLEMGMLDNRINLVVAYFRNRSSNQLVDRPLAGSVGFQNMISNFPATVENKGLEITLNGRAVSSNSFQWNTGFNISINRNKLLDFPNFEFSGYQNNLTIGEPINSRKIFRYAGINAETGLYEFYDRTGKVVSTPIPPEDRQSFIDLSPRFFGGFNNNVSYKGLSLDFTFQFVKQMGQNYLLRNTTFPGYLSLSAGEGNQPLAVTDRWTPQNKTATFQRYSQDGSVYEAYINASESDFAYSDASFIRLKNVSLSYSLPDGVSKKLRIDKARVFLQGQNLLTITGYKGIDPETQSLNTLPPLRIITAGIHLTL